LSDNPPAISVMFADPPSVEGTCGPQLVLLAEPPPAADPDAVVFAVCVDVSEASPGNCKGISGSLDADVAPPPVLPALDPLVPAPEPGVDDGKGDAGIVRGSDATVPLAPLD